MKGFFIALAGVLAVAASGCGAVTAAAGSAPSTSNPSLVITVPATSPVDSEALPVGRQDEMGVDPADFADSSIPERVPTVWAQRLGEYAADALSLAGLGELKVAEAVEMVLPDTTVTDIVLAPRADGAKVLC